MEQARQDRVQALEEDLESAAALEAAAAGAQARTATVFAQNVGPYQPIRQAPHALM